MLLHSFKLSKFALKNTYEIYPRFKFHILHFSSSYEEIYPWPYCFATPAKNICGRHGQVLLCTSHVSRIFVHCEAQAENRVTCKWEPPLRSNLRRWKPLFRLLYSQEASSYTTVSNVLVLRTFDKSLVVFLYPDFSDQFFWPAFYSASDTTDHTPSYAEAKKCEIIEAS